MEIVPGPPHQSHPLTWPTADFFGLEMDAIPPSRDELPTSQACLSGRGNENHMFGVGIEWERCGSPHAHSHSASIENS